MRTSEQDWEGDGTHLETADMVQGLWLGKLDAFLTGVLGMAFIFISSLLSLFFFLFIFGSMGRAG